MSVLGVLLAYAYDPTYVYNSLCNERRYTSLQHRHVLTSHVSCESLSLCSLQRICAGLPCSLMCVLNNFAYAVPAPAVTNHTCRPLPQLVMYCLCKAVTVGSAGSCIAGCSVYVGCFRSLEFMRCGRVTGQGIAVVAQSCAGLTNFKLHNCPEVYSSLLCASDLNDTVLHSNMYTSTT